MRNTLIWREWIENRLSFYPRVYSYNTIWINNETISLIKFQSADRWYHIQVWNSNGASIIEPQHFIAGVVTEMFITCVIIYYPNSELYENWNAEIQVNKCEWWNMLHTDQMVTRICDVCRQKELITTFPLKFQNVYGEIVTKICCNTAWRYQNHAFGITFLYNHAFVIII